MNQKNRTGRPLRRSIVEIDDGHGTPMTLVEAALKRREEERRAEKKGRGDAHTEYWCVFDRDEHPMFSEAVRLAEREKISLAVSNPCLERSALQSKSRQLLKCNKTLTQEALDLLAEETRYEAARQRAAKLDVKHEGDGSPPGSNPSSSMYTLIDRIRRGTER